MDEINQGTQNRQSPRSSITAYFGSNEDEALPQSDTSFALPSTSEFVYKRNALEPIEASNSELLSEAHYNVSDVEINDTATSEIDSITHSIDYTGGLLPSFIFESIQKRKARTVASMASAGHITEANNLPQRQFDAPPVLNVSSVSTPDDSPYVQHNNLASAAPFDFPLEVVPERESGIQTPKDEIILITTASDGRTVWDKESGIIISPEDVRGRPPPELQTVEGGIRERRGEQVITHSYRREERNGGKAEEGKKTDQGSKEAGEVELFPDKKNPESNYKAPSAETDRHWPTSSMASFIKGEVHRSKSTTPKRERLDAVEEERKDTFSSPEEGKGTASIGGEKTTGPQSSVVILNASSALSKDNSLQRALSGTSDVVEKPIVRVREGSVIEESRRRVQNFVSENTNQEPETYEGNIAAVNRMAVSDSEGGNDSTVILSNMGDLKKLAISTSMQQQISRSTSPAQSTPFLSSNSVAHQYSAQGARSQDQNISALRQEESERAWGKGSLEQTKEAFMAGKKGSFRVEDRQEKRNNQGDKFGGPRIVSSPIPVSTYLQPRPINRNMQDQVPVVGVEIYREGDSVIHHPVAVPSSHRGIPVMEALSERDIIAVAPVTTADRVRSLRTALQSKQPRSNESSASPLSRRSSRRDLKHYSNTEYLSPAAKYLASGNSNEEEVDEEEVSPFIDASVNAALPLAGTEMGNTASLAEAIALEESEKYELMQNLAAYSPMNSILREKEDPHEDERLRTLIRGEMTQFLQALETRFSFVPKTAEPQPKIGASKIDSRDYQHPQMPIATVEGPLVYYISPSTEIPQFFAQETIHQTKAFDNRNHTTETISPVEESDVSQGVPVISSVIHSQEHTVANPAPSRVTEQRQKEKLTKVDNRKTINKTLPTSTKPSTVRVTSRERSRSQGDGLKELVSINQPPVRQKEVKVSVGVNTDPLQSYNTVFGRDNVCVSHRGSRSRSLGAYQKSPKQSSPQKKPIATRTISVGESTTDEEFIEGREFKEERERVVSAKNLKGSKTEKKRVEKDERIYREELKPEEETKKIKEESNPSKAYLQVSAGQLLSHVLELVRGEIRKASKKRVRKQMGTKSSPTGGVRWRTLLSDIKGISSPKNLFQFSLPPVKSFDNLATPLQNTSPENPLLSSSQNAPLAINAAASTSQAVNVVGTQPTLSKEAINLNTSVASNRPLETHTSSPPVLNRSMTGQNQGNEGSFIGTSTGEKHIRQLLEAIKHLRDGFASLSIRTAALEKQVSFNEKHQRKFNESLLKDCQEHQKTVKGISECIRRGSLLLTGEGKDEEGKRHKKFVLQTTTMKRKNLRQRKLRKENLMMFYPDIPLLFPQSQDIHKGALPPSAGGHDNTNIPASFPPPVAPRSIAHPSFVPEPPIKQDDNVHAHASGRPSQSPFVPVRSSYTPPIASKHPSNSTSLETSARRGISTKRRSPSPEIRSSSQRRDARTAAMHFVASRGISPSFLEIQDHYGPRIRPEGRAEINRGRKEMPSLLPPRRIATVSPFIRGPTLRDLESEREKKRVYAYDSEVRYIPVRDIRPVRTQSHSPRLETARRALERENLQHHPQTSKKKTPVELSSTHNRPAYATANRSYTTGNIRKTIPTQRPNANIKQQYQKYFSRK